MKRLASIILSLLFVSSIYTKALGINKPVSTKNYIITLNSADTLPLDKVKSHGFNTVMLMVPTIRNVKSPYNTSYSRLRTLYYNISALEAKKLHYFLCFTSGPGFFDDSNSYSIFTNILELRSYSKMVNEVVKRYDTNKYFSGVSIDLEAPEIAASDYYRVQDFIINNLQTNYPKINIVYNLHPLVFENNYKNLPNIKSKTYTYNLTVNFTALTYPGYGAAYKTSYVLDKNTLLASFEKYKDFLTTNKINALITYKTPWVKNSDVLLQDSYEIFKMLKFDLDLSCGNSLDQYDFTNNSSVMSVIDRHNK